MDRNEPDILLKPAAREKGFEEFMAGIEIPHACSSDAAGSTVSHG
jgi:hypothetical protein